MNIARTFVAAILLAATPMPGIANPPVDEAAKELDNLAAHPGAPTPYLNAMSAAEPKPPAGAARAERIWRAALPRSIEHTSYIRGEYVSHGWDEGKVFGAQVLVLHGCQPHNCGDVNFVAIVHLPGSKAIGLAVDDDGMHPRLETFVGNPTPVQRRCLENMVGDYTATDCGSPAH